jgi:hypothetical protein
MRHAPRQSRRVSTLSAKTGCQQTLAGLILTCTTRHHAQINDVVELLAERSRRADWASGASNFGQDFAMVREKWKAHITDPVEGPKETDRIDARKHRLMNLFRSADCYSANVHAKTNDLDKLVNSLVRSSVDLAGCGLDIDAALFVATFARDNDSQSAFKDRLNDIISQESGKVIAKALKKNKSLTNLNLYNTHISPESGLAIAESLKYNRSLEKLE